MTRKIIKQKIKKSRRKKNGVFLLLKPLWLYDNLLPTAAQSCVPTQLGDIMVIDDTSMQLIVEALRRRVNARYVILIVGIVRSGSYGSLLNCAPLAKTKMMVMICRVFHAMHIKLVVINFNPVVSRHICLLQSNKLILINIRNSKGL